MTQKWIQLFQLLLQKTKSGDLLWAETADDQSFLASIGKNKIIYEQGSNFGGGYAVHIMSNEGKVVDNFDMHDLAVMTGGDWSEEGEELFSLIRRRLSGADEVLDDILSELDQPF